MVDTFSFAIIMFLGGIAYGLIFGAWFERADNKHD